MVKPREGYHGLFLQIPAVLWDDLCAEAERDGGSATAALTRILARHFRRKPEELPARKRAGRPPKGGTRR